MINLKCVLSSHHSKELSLYKKIKEACCVFCVKKDKKTKWWSLRAVCCLIWEERTESSWVLEYQENGEVLELFELRGKEKGLGNKENEGFREMSSIWEKGFSIANGLIIIIRVT